MDTVERDRGQYDRPASVFWATGAALMVRRSDWNAAGGLDARFFAHMEEVDFCWRLKARGRGVVCRKEFASICHDFDDARRENLRLTTAGSIPERARGSLLWAYYALGRHTYGELTRSRKFQS